MTGLEQSALSEALDLIATEGCEHFVKPWTCRDEGSGKARSARNGADRWCYPCVARDALDGNSVGIAPTFGLDQQIREEIAQDVYGPETLELALGAVLDVDIGANPQTPYRHGWNDALATVRAVVAAVLGIPAGAPRQIRPMVDGIFREVWLAVGERTADSNPGRQLVMNARHLASLAHDGEPPTDTSALRVFGYPIRVDEAVSEMYLERTDVQ